MTKSYVEASYTLPQSAVEVLTEASKDDDVSVTFFREPAGATAVVSIEPRPSDTEGNIIDDAIDLIEDALDDLIGDTHDWDSPFKVSIIDPDLMVVDIISTPESYFAEQLTIDDVDTDDDGLAGVGAKP